jgi:hypothetical protein
LKESDNEPLRDIQRDGGIGAMSLGGWQSWKDRLRELQSEAVAVENVRRALNAVNEGD